MAMILHHAAAVVPENARDKAWSSEETTGRAQHSVPTISRSLGHFAC
jgi:hypothetical protein